MPHSGPAYGNRSLLLDCGDNISVSTIHSNVNLSHIRYLGLTQQFDIDEAGRCSSRRKAAFAIQPCTELSKLRVRAGM
jgi:hypothetical protein